MTLKNLSDGELVKTYDSARIQGKSDAIPAIRMEMVQRFKRRNRPERQ